MQGRGRKLVAIQTVAPALPAADCVDRIVQRMQGVGWLCGRINRPEPIVLVHFGPYAQFLHFGDHRGEPMYFGDHVVSPWLRVLFRVLPRRGH